MITGRRRIVAPTDPIVSLAEMYLHLHLDTEGSPPTHPEDDTIALYVQAATDDTEGEDGWIGRALLPQQWRVSWDCFPYACNKNPDAALHLPYPPLISVDEVAYLDSSGARVVMDPSAYEVVTEGDPHGYVRMPYRQIWPVTADRNNSVQVTFTAGYDASASSPNALPDSIKHYIMVLAGLMYQHREINLTNAQLQPIANFHAAAQRFRVFGP